MEYFSTVVKTNYQGLSVHKGNRWIFCKQNHCATFLSQHLHDSIPKFTALFDRQLKVDIVYKMGFGQELGVRFELDMA